MENWIRIGFTTAIIIVISGPAVPQCRKPVLDGAVCGDKKCPIDDGCGNCSQCPCLDGYTSYNETVGKGNSYKIECEDIHECIERTHQCGANSGCKNTIGGYNCTCDKGYRRGNVTVFCPTDDKTENVCSDIDECEEYPDICGTNSICTNTKGSYNCTCISGFMNVSSQCAVKCKTTSENQPPCNDTEPRCSIKNFTDLWTPQCTGNSSLDYPNVDQLLDGLNAMIDKFSNYNKTERLEIAGTLLDSVEGIIGNLAYMLHKSKPPSNKQNYISIKLVNQASVDEQISLSNRNGSIILQAKTALEKSSTSLVGCVEYGNIHKLLEGAHLQNELQQQQVKVVSSVVSVFLGIDKTANLSQAIQMQFNLNEGEKVDWNKTQCAFWSVREKAWSTKGCQTIERHHNKTVCNCTHLTSFAVLMALHDIKSWTLELITKIGLSISIVCLSLAIVTFCYCRFLRGTRNTIHIHVCVCLLLGHCIFLIGIEATSSRPVCGIVAGLLHFFYLSSFCWMSLEGLELYLMLVTVFKTQVKTRYLLAGGYGVPAVIITISAAVYAKGYGTQHYCWLSLENNFIWSFMGPVCVIILVNCGIFILTVWKLAEKMTTINPEQGKLKRIRTLTVTSVAQLCILGCCWAFGFLMFGKATLFFAYAFTICNVLQGVQIFLLHCLMNKKVRETYGHVICALAHFRSPHYSEFSNSTNANTQSRSKPSKESGL